MANDRRIITGTHVVAKEGKDLETGTKYIMDTTVGKSLGGKSTVTDMDATQWHGSEWYQASQVITTAPTKLGADASPLKFLYIRNLDATIEVVVSLGVEQLWNTGWQNAVGGGDSGKWNYATYTARSPNYDGWWDEGMHIRIPAEASIELRGDDTYGLIQEVYVRTAIGQASSSIEYVIAQ
jgi:hypothetical protein